MVNTFVTNSRTWPQRLAALDRCRNPSPVVDTQQTVRFPSVSGEFPLFKVGRRLVAVQFNRADAQYVASRTACAHALLRHLFGERIRTWDRPRVYFVTEEAYEAFIHSRHDDEATRKKKLRTTIYAADDCEVVLSRTRDGALDRYTHTIGGWTTWGITLPVPDRQNNGRAEGYPWLFEGVGLFLTLQLHDTAETWLYSPTASTGKADPSRPLPRVMRQETCLAYMRDQLLAGALPPLRELWGNSLNNLDQFRALQSWTFVRFLALYDPNGFRDFPGELRKETKGPRVERAERAMERAFGKNPAELARLWRAYTLELS